MSEAKHSPDNKLFNYICEIGVIPIDTEIHEIRLIVYEELGLSGIDNPREWVEVTKEERVEAHVSFWKEKAENNQWRCNQLQSEITKLKSELKQAKADKAEAWDEGFKSGKNYVESSMSCDEGVRLPENPYKPDFNQNSMLERFGELEDEFKVE